MDSFVGGSPRRMARIAGALYLINIVGGAFAIGFVPAILFSPDLAATAHNIQTHELLYRSGLMAHLLVTVTNVPMAVLFFDLFRVVNRRLALLDVFFTLVGTAIEAAGLLNQFAPLVLLGSGPSTSDLSAIDYDIYTVFYGFDIICVGYLVFTSMFLPRAMGVLLAIDGLAYLVHSATDVLAPGFAAHLVPWINLPALVGEGSLCLWLLILGVDAERWKKRAVQGPADLRPPDQPHVAAALD
jgi:hypothetical protein